MYPFLQTIRIFFSSSSNNSTEEGEEEVSSLSTKETEKLNKEIERLKASHEKEKAKIQRANDKLIEDYKATNLQLQKNAPSASSSVFTDLSSLEADDSLFEAVSCNNNLF